jgi:hypothetical protein
LKEERPSRTTVEDIADLNWDRDKLKELFDEQVQKLFANIDTQIRALEVQQPNERIVQSSLRYLESFR